tara:strand:+ start:933 stop:1082 length:150 start_codon:yes stop_codon:yes gene_type:complete
MADRVVVMYRGLKVDEGRVEDIFANPQHDYQISAVCGAKAGRDAGHVLA